MNNREFDRMLRQRAANEKMTLTEGTEDHFRDMMDLARFDRAQRYSEPVRKKGWIVALIAAECLVMAALMLLFLPSKDITRQGALNRETQETMMTAMVPVTQPKTAQTPEVNFEAIALEEEASLYTSFVNHTNETWLMEWSAQLKGDNAKTEGHIWLEPGSECTEHLAWIDPEQEAVINAEYRAYRVQAPMLLWIDSETLLPDSEEYQEQQSLMEAAFEAKALILAPGDWENGQAGSMMLAMPSRFKSENPETTAVEYYVTNGMLEDASALCSGRKQITLTGIAEAE